MSLAEITTPRPLPRVEHDHAANRPQLEFDASFEVDIPDGWQQGKGAFGGLALSAMARALESTASGVGSGESSPRSLRSMTAQLFGPIMPGKVRIDTKMLRAGSGVSTLAASLTQDGAPQAHAVAVFGRGRTATSYAPPPPTLKNWRDVPRVPVRAPFGPRFASNFDYRFTGHVPFSNAPEATTEGWVRPIEPGRLRDAGYVVALSDAWFPSALVQETEMRPMATIAFTFELFATLHGLDPEAPLFHRGRCVAGTDGYLLDFRELWGEDGRLVAMNQQTIVVIK